MILILVPDLSVILSAQVLHLFDTWISLSSALGKFLGIDIPFWFYGEKKAIFNILTFTVVVVQFCSAEHFRNH